MDISEVNVQIVELFPGQVYQFYMDNGDVVPIEIIEPVEGMPGFYHAVINGVEYESLPLQQMADDAMERRIKLEKEDSSSISRIVFKDAEIPADKPENAMTNNASLDKTTDTPIKNNSHNVKTDKPNKIA